MEKEIFATNIDGFLVKHEAFIEPHKAWFDRVIKLTGNESLGAWKDRHDYFKGVDIAMKLIKPDASDEERTAQARDWYQEDVVSYIREHPDVVYREVAESLRKLKDRFRLALITVNTKEYIGEILEAAGLVGLYDIVFAVSKNEKPDKAKLFDEFVRQYGKPKYYVAGRSKEAFEKCLSLGSICIYASWDEFDGEIKAVASRVIEKPGEIESL